MTINNSFILVVWSAKYEKVELHVNNEGIDELIDYLRFLKNKKEPDHVHLMTPAWGGNSLVEDEVSEGATLVNHLKICKIYPEKNSTGDEVS